MRLCRHGVVFYFHPRHHRFPWAVASLVANANIRTTIFRLAFAAHKRLFAVALEPQVRRLDAVVVLDPCQRAAHINVRRKFGSMLLAFLTIRSGRVTESPRIN